MEFQLQHQSFQRTLRTDFLWDGLVGSPCHPRDCQKSFPTPQFKSINSLVLSFLYSPTLTSIHDYSKNHSLGFLGGEQLQRKLSNAVSTSSEVPRRMQSWPFFKRLFSSSLSAIRVVVIGISEDIDISPGNLDSSLCFIQPGILQDVLCI